MKNENRQWKLKTYVIVNVTFSKLSNLFLISLGISLDIESILWRQIKLINAFWVLHSKTDLQDARMFCKLMGYSKGFEEVNKHRFKVFRNGK